jgi:hypothetical protein
MCAGGFERERWHSGRIGEEGACRVTPQDMCGGAGRTSLLYAKTIVDVPLHGPTAG